MTAVRSGVAAGQMIFSRCCASEHRWHSPPQIRGSRGALPRLTDYAAEDLKRKMFTRSGAARWRAAARPLVYCFGKTDTCRVLRTAFLPIRHIPGKKEVARKEGVLSVVLNRWTHTASVT
jgi:hypothetical protein